MLRTQRFPLEVRRYPERYLGRYPGRHLAFVRRGWPRFCVSSPNELQNWAVDVSRALYEIAPNTRTMNDRQQTLTLGYRTAPDGLLAFTP